MTVYNINLGIGWASSGVEYAQSYRDQSFKLLGTDAKFIFSDLVLGNNLADLTANLDFEDSQIVWLYNFFTDVKIAPSTYSPSQLEQDLDVSHRDVEKTIDKAKSIIIYNFKDEDFVAVARMDHHSKSNGIDQVSYVANNQMVSRDFFSYTKYATEYYSGTQQNNHVTFRQFYNEDGSVAYVQHLNHGKELYEFADNRIYYSKNDLYREFLKELHFKQGDVIIIDRLDEDKQLQNAQLVFENHGPAKLVVVVHAEHYDENYTNDSTILWNNFYEYQFTRSKDIAAYVVATDKQREILTAQQKKYYNADVNVVTIPVGSLPELRHPDPKNPRRRHSLITASRLANEKHVDWLIQAVVKAHEQVPDLTFDIYGRGSNAGKLSQMIQDYKANDYIKLMGQHDLTNIYIKYAAYIAASTSEGFGLSLLEAVGSGLPMIGFDVPYGNQTFIDDGHNGSLIPYQNDWPTDKKVDLLAQAIVKLFTSDQEAAFSKWSYELAEPYLTQNVAKRWEKLLEELQHD